MQKIVEKTSREAKSWYDTRAADRGAHLDDESRGVPATSFRDWTYLDATTLGFGVFVRPGGDPHFAIHAYVKDFPGCPDGAKLTCSQTSTVNCCHGYCKIDLARESVDGQCSQRGFLSGKVSQMSFIHFDTYVKPQHAEVKSGSHSSCDQTLPTDEEGRGHLKEHHRAMFHAEDDLMKSFRADGHLVAQVYWPPGEQGQQLCLELQTESPELFEHRAVDTSNFPIRSKEDVSFAFSFVVVVCFVA